MTDVLIRQITPLMSGGAGPEPFINVVHESNYVEVWGVVSYPTYLLRKGTVFSIAQFPDEDTANTWISEKESVWDSIVRLMPVVDGEALDVRYL